jgi:hypothetical protein
MVPRSTLDVNALAVTAYVLRKWSALRGERLDLRIGPLPRLDARPVPTFN